MKSLVWSPKLILLLGCLLALTASAQETPIDLSQNGAASQWVFTDTNGKLEGGELVLDGRSEITKAFYAPQEWSNVTLKAKFKVDPGDGVLACGFIVRAKDGSNYYYVHYDKGQAILCRSSEDKAWIEVKRVGNLDKPAGAWHEGQVECTGNTLKVSLNGKLLYEAKENRLTAGRIGFYASQGLAHVKDITVTGAAKKAEGKLVFPESMWRTVCKDAGAGGYEAFPDICRLQDGRLMCVFYAGYGHVALPNEKLPKGGRVSYCISEDEGCTWSSAKVLYDGPDDDRDPSIVQLKSGRLICNYFSLRKNDDPKKRWDGLGSWIVMSDDLGKTWSKPLCVSPTYYCSSPVRELSNGRLILGLYAEENGEGWGAAAYSDDQGKSWSKVVDMDNAGMKLDAETDIIELKDGTLYAAQRGRGKTMAWSISKDKGVTWSVSEPYGFPGHCPYLHRTNDGIILMATRTHQLRETSLYYSLDEGKTWSERETIDEVIGAYPSMVTLDDGSILVVYYEEGAGSSIRSKRFRVSKAGVEWIPVEEGRTPSATLVEAYRIWDEAPHSAFTNLIRYKGAWYCVFREGHKHASPDGALRVITSQDGKTWTSAARITSDTADLRDAQICITPTGQLMLSGAAALHQPADAKHQTMAYFSDDGRTWTEGVPIGDPDMWLWRVTWHKDAAYGFGYSTTLPREERFLRLYKSTDGKKFDALIPALRTNEYANESCMVFEKDDTCHCLLRRDNKGGDTNGLLGTSRPPYTDWTWQDLGNKIGGPCMIQLPDGRFMAAVRRYNGKTRTSVCAIDPEAGTMTEMVALPSGGDTSYPGMVWHDGLLWVSYYSSHEGKTMIYLAKVKIDGV